MTLACISDIWVTVIQDSTFISFIGDVKFRKKNFYTNSPIQATILVEYVHMWRGVGEQEALIHCQTSPSSKPQPTLKNVLHYQGLIRTTVSFVMSCCLVMGKSLQEFSGDG